MLDERVVDSVGFEMFVSVTADVLGDKTVEVFCVISVLLVSLSMLVERLQLHKSTTAIAAQTVCFRIFWLSWNILLSRVFLEGLYLYRRKKFRFVTYF